MTSKCFVHECAPQVLFKGHGEDGRGDGEMIVVVKCRGEEAGNCFYRSFVFFEVY